MKDDKQNQETPQDQTVPPEETASNLPEQNVPPADEVDASEAPRNDYEAASQAMDDDSDQDEEPYDDYSNHAVTRDTPKHTARKVLLIVFVILVVAALTAGAYYWFFMKKDSTKNKPVTSAVSQSKQASEEQSAVAINTETKHYKSTNFTLEFDYPKDWTVSETDNSGKLTVTSPTVKLGSTQGVVTLMIRNKQQLLPEFDKGNAVAARESEKITYTKPSSTQRGQTYISFLHFAGSTSASTEFAGIYITGNTGYKAAQAVPKADLTPVDPIINLAFTKTDGTTLYLPATVWENTAVATPLRSILTSLTIQ